MSRAVGVGLVRAGLVAARGRLVQRAVAVMSGSRARLAFPATVRVVVVVVVRSAPGERMVASGAGGRRLRRAARVVRAASDSPRA
jgi:hypothetical protein